MNLDEIRRLKQKYEDTWMKYDDVYGVGIGYKTVNGVKTDQISIIVYTTNKKPLNNIPEAQRIPESIEQIPVDIVQRKLPAFFDQETADIQAAANAPDINMYRPMVGGIQLCHLHEQTSQYYILSIGTLGMFVKCKNDPQNLYILTNWHVLEKEAMDIYQPMYDGRKSPLLLAAGESHGSYYECADAGIAKVLLPPENVRSNVIAELGELRGIYKDELTLGQLVKKRGRTTLVTHGTVIDIDAYVSNGTQTFKHQVIVEGIDPEDRKIAKGGDSGSIVLTYDEEIEENNNAVLGLLWGGNEDENIMVYSPIEYVFKSLNLEMCS